MLKSHSPRSLRLSLWSLGAFILLPILTRPVLRWQLHFAREMEGTGLLWIFVFPVLVILAGVVSVVAGVCSLKQRRIAWLWIAPTAVCVAWLLWALVLDVARFWHLFREAGVAFSDLVAKQSILSAAAVGVLVAVLVPKSWKKWSDGFVQRHQTLLWWTVGILFALIPLVVFWNL